ncbi:hypothetical protein, variant [Aphanomyces invadans]|nr:hypothetical protein, variant [Aphanomyces invadans]ETW08836.1 hypothetical protein, variant [Aphanomyces invadans]|eukprot:XP_008862641.1 hypothetical protein, variant [Aphanomyces invadans]
MEWLASSTTMDIYITSLQYLTLTTVLTPTAFLLLESYWRVIAWTDCQYFMLLAVFDLTVSSVLWHIYSLAHLNPSLRHL